MSMNSSEQNLVSGNHAYGPFLYNFLAVVTLTRVNPSDFGFVTDFKTRFCCVAWCASTSWFFPFSLPSVGTTGMCYCTISVLIPTPLVSEQFFSNIVDSNRVDFVLVGLIWFPCVGRRDRWQGVNSSKPFWLNSNNLRNIEWVGRIYLEPILKF